MIDPNAPVVLIETGVKAEGFDSNVLVTKDDSITNVTIPWDEPDAIDEAFIDEAIAVLEPLAPECPRFGVVVHRLRARKAELNAEVNGA